MTQYSTYTSQQAHDDITALFDAYYDAKKAGDSIPPNKRVESADAIVEQYVEVNGKRPSASVLRSEERRVGKECRFRRERGPASGNKEAEWRLQKQSMIVS